MAKKKSRIELKHSGIENVVVLGMILAFFIILAPLVYSELPQEGAGAKYDTVTGLAASNVVEYDATTAILIVLAIAFLIPVELSLRHHGFKKESKKR